MDLPINSMVIFHSYVSFPEGKFCIFQESFICLYRNHGFLLRFPWTTSNHQLHPWDPHTPLPISKDVYPAVVKCGWLEIAKPDGGFYFQPAIFLLREGTLEGQRLHRCGFPRRASHSDNDHHTWWWVNSTWNCKLPHKAVAEVSKIGNL